jgi:acetoin utilization protein AcuC
MRQRLASVSEFAPHAARAAASQSVFVTHPIFQEPAWGSLHPLSISRHAAVIELCAALGWLPGNALRTCEMAPFETLIQHHDEAYVAALRRASQCGKSSLEERALYNFGTMENPLFPSVYERAAAAVGGAIAAAEAALEGRRAFHPAGGTHHGKRARASGFCYFNDPVFAIRTLLTGGADPVLYVDIDAHHGDGVQEAFADDPRVFMVSIHEAGRWPHTGELNDRGGGNVRNIPVPSGLNDSELTFLVDRAVRPLAERLEPQSIVVVAGADCLAGDPLSSTAVSNTAFWDAVEQLCALAPAQVVLGGGGYNPWTTARAWSGLWARLAGREIPSAPPAAARMLLEGLSCDLIDDDERDPLWTSTLADPPNRGAVREEVRRAACVATAP